MNIKGKCLWWYHDTQVVEADATAVLEPNRIVLDWDQMPANGHLEAESKDGLFFTGQWGMPELFDFRGLELTRYQSGDKVLFFGKWWNSNSGDEGGWLFRFPAE